MLTFQVLKKLEEFYTLLLKASSEEKNKAGSKTKFFQKHCFVVRVVCKSNNSAYPSFNFFIPIALDQ